MRTPRVHTAQLLHPGARIELEAEPAHHLARVLRVKPGRALELFNGDGDVFAAQVAAVERAAVSVEVGEVIAAAPESPLRIELGIAVPANDRMDWLLQKATELGVTRVSPLLTERSQSNIKRAQKRLGHWQRVVISACEQCGRARLPETTAPSPLSAWLAQPFTGTQLALLPDASNNRLPGNIASDLRLLVGPEGGLDSAEIEAAITAGFTPWQLGPRILRSETAPLAAVAILQYVAGDFVE